MPSKHVVITGTGRAGTSFLVEILTQLGLDTGFEPEDMASRRVKGYSRAARGGLEHDIRKPGAPYIVKSPWFCDYAEEVLQMSDIMIEHVFIPMRDLQAAAESRRRVSQEYLAQQPFIRRWLGRLKPPPLGVPGGLWHTRSARKQESALQQQIYKLARALSDTAIPVTLLRYPKIVKDSLYLYDKLKPILTDVTYDQFQPAFQISVKPQWTHRLSANDC